MINTLIKYKLAKINIEYGHRVLMFIDNFRIRMKDFKDKIISISNLRMIKWMWLIKFNKIMQMSDPNLQILDSLYRSEIRDNI